VIVSIICNRTLQAPLRHFGMIYDKAAVIFFRPIKDNYMKWIVFPAIPFVSINECQAKHVYAIAKDASALEICNSSILLISS
jgi:hypothetical protein